MSDSIALIPELPSIARHVLLGVACAAPAAIAGPRRVLVYAAAYGVILGKEAVDLAWGSGVAEAIDVISGAAAIGLVMLAIETARARAALARAMCLRLAERRHP